MRVDTGTYLNSHGQTPRGRGQWMFAFWKDGQATEWMAPCQMTYSEALSEAKKEAREHGTDVVTVLP